MIDMVKVLNDHYFWLSLAWISSGVVMFIVGFLTCFFYCNYTVVKKEVTMSDMEKHLQKTDFWTNLLKRHKKES